jgi:aerobic C4-dicarboxylate transport protein
LLAIIPETFIGAFAKGDLLQVLLVSILTGFAISQLGQLGERINGVIEAMAKVFFGIIRIIVRAAPIGALGAMAFTVGAYGVGSLLNLVELIATFYLTSLIFVLVVLGTIARLAGFSILRFIAYIKDELLIVLGTSSSETVLPHMIQKMERLGASKSVVGLVIPTGYSFNLDGTNIYMTLATLFLAQATNTPLTIGQELSILAIAMITSKGASGVTGAGFVTLAATLAIVPDIPIGSLAILVGIDKFIERMPGAHQSRRQRRRYHRHQPMGARARRHQAEGGHAASGRHGRRARAAAGVISCAVVPTKAGTHCAKRCGLWNMGSRFRGNDDRGTPRLHTT